MVIHFVAPAIHLDLVQCQLPTKTRTGPAVSSDSLPVPPAAPAKSPGSRKPPGAPGCSEVYRIQDRRSDFDRAAARRPGGDLWQKMNARQEGLDLMDPKRWGRRQAGLMDLIAEQTLIAKPRFTRSGSICRLLGNSRPVAKSSPLRHRTFPSRKASLRLPAVISLL